MLNVYIEPFFNTFPIILMRTTILESCFMTLIASQKQKRLSTVHLN